MAHATCSRRTDKLFIDGQAPGPDPSSAFMGIGIWTFLRQRQGELRPVSMRALDGFVSGSGRLPVEDDGFVRYAQVIVSLENRRAIEVVRVGFYQHRALKNGTLDREHFQKLMAIGSEAATGGILASRTLGVVDAGHRFAKRRLDHMQNWKPTKAEHAKLRELVNAKAGREIM